MASRNLTVDNMDITTEDVLSLMFKNGATGDSPTTFVAIAAEMGVSKSDIFDALENVDETFVDSDHDGNLWFTVAYESDDEMRAEFVAVHAEQFQENSAETSQTGLTRAEVIKSARNVELTMPNVVGIWENPSHDSHMIDYVKGEAPNPGFTRMPEPKPEAVKPCPVGVSPNIWELMWYAPTLSGKRYWQAKVTEQQKAYEAGSEVEETAAENAEYEYETDENGMPVL